MGLRSLHERARTLRYVYTRELQLCLYHTLLPVQQIGICLPPTAQRQPQSCPHQVVASDIGATVLGIDGSNVREYLLELMYAVVAGQLPASKFIVGLKASGVSMEAQSPAVLVQLLW